MKEGSQLDVSTAAAVLSPFAPRTASAPPHTASTGGGRHQKRGLCHPRPSIENSIFKVIKIPRRMMFHAPFPRRPISGGFVSAAAVFCLNHGGGGESGEQVAAAAAKAAAAVPDRPPALPWARVLISRPPPTPPPTRSAPLPSPP